MATLFSRQLGYEAGTQLNSRIDETEQIVPDNYDQIMSIAMRLTRGRIDKAFQVDRSNYRQKCGEIELLRKSELNEASEHVYEALDNGAYAAVIARLVSQEAEVKWAVISKAVDTDGLVFTVQDEAPSSGYLIAVKHLGCFNDGIRLSIHAEEAFDEMGVEVASKNVTLRVMDPNGNVLDELSGSLDMEAKDDYGVSKYLPSVFEKNTDEYEIRVALNAEIPVESPAYGLDDSGFENFATSNVLIAFTEGTTAYTVDDYMAARDKLHYCGELKFGYIATGGNQSPAFLVQMAKLSFETNRPLRADIKGSLKPQAVGIFVDNVALYAQKEPMNISWVWSPIMCDSPSGKNGRYYMGTSSLKIANACYRNSQTNEYGFARKNWPIAGKVFPLARTGMKEMYTPKPHELSYLAKKKVNPVLYQEFSGGGRFVWRDSLTAAPVDNSMIKLESVADMACDIEHRFILVENDLNQMPQEEAINRWNAAAEFILEGARFSKWLIPPSPGKPCYAYQIQRSKARTADRLEAKVWCIFDGTTRQLVHQTIITTKINS